MKKIVFCCGSTREVFTYPDGVKPSEVDTDFNKWCEKIGYDDRKRQMISETVTNINFKEMFKK